LCATLSFLPVSQRKSSCRRCRFNILPLRNAGFLSQFADRVVYLVKSGWNEDTDGLTKWKNIKDGLLEASNSMLGLSRRHQPDWFSKSEEILRPLIDRHNKFFSVWLQSHNHRDRQKFLTLAARKVWECKNKWYQEKDKSIPSRALSRET